MNTCNTCNKPLIGWQKKYCSRSCSAKSTNTTPKRKKVICLCLVCKTETKNNRTKFCQNCIQDGWPYSWPLKPISLRTLKEEIELNAYQKANKYNRIRGLVRFKNLKNKSKKCYKCGYDKHVENCHIKPISDFPLTTLIKDINHESNIVVLCPNCHWEFDNGLFII